MKYYIFLLSILLLPQTILSIVFGSNTDVSRQSALFFPSSDADNKILGFAACEQGFSLESSLTTCTYDAFFPVASTISLRGGTCYLNQDLILEESTNFVTLGTIYGNEHALKFTGTTAMVIPSREDSEILNLIAEYDMGVDVYSVDWSFDDKYIAVATTNPLTSLSILYFDGQSLTLTASEDFGKKVESIRWHPSEYVIAVGGSFGLIDELEIWSFDPMTGLVQKDTIDCSATVNAISWHPTGNYLMIGKVEITDEIVLYSVSETYTLTQKSQLDLTNTPERDAIDWNPTGNYFAVGIAKCSQGGELNIGYFDGSIITLTNQAEIGQTIFALDWSPTGSFIAVGLGGGIEKLLVYEYNSSTNTLVEKTSARIGETKNILSVDWSHDGNYLVIGRVSAPAGTEFRLYSFDKDASTLSLISDSDCSSNIDSVRFSHDSAYIARGCTADQVGVYVGPFYLGGDLLVFRDSKLSFLNANVTLNESAKFQGTCAVDGKEHSLYLGDDGNIIVDSGASLLLENITLKNISGNKVRCLDSASTLSLRNVDWLQEGDFSFTEGHFDIVGDLLISGTHLFTYQSDQVSTIQDNAKIFFDMGMTFSYDTSSSNLISMDSRAQIHLFETTLFSGVPGLHLKSGILKVQGECPVSSDATQTSEGVTFGDGVSASNDLTVKPLPESGLNISSGYLVYKNVAG